MKYFFIFLTYFLIIANVKAQPGTLDMSIGKNSIVISSENYNSCQDMVLQPDGKIIQVGAGSYKRTSVIFCLKEFKTPDKPAVTILPSICKARS